jgi:hypothetical protein
VIVLALACQGCASTGSKPIYNPESATQQKMDMGFTGDLSVGTSLGHSVPVEGEVIRTPRCTSADQKCRD